MQYRASLLMVAACLACSRPAALPTGPADAVALDTQTGGADAGPAIAADAAADRTLPADAAPAEVSPPASCSNSMPAPLRRLTNVHYQRTIRELTGVSIATPLQ